MAAAIFATLAPISALTVADQWSFDAVGEVSDRNIPDYWDYHLWKARWTNVFTKSLTGVIKYLYAFMIFFQTRRIWLRDTVSHHTDNVTTTTLICRFTAKALLPLIWCGSIDHFLFATIEVFSHASSQVLVSPAAGCASTSFGHLFRDTVQCTQLSDNMESPAELDTLSHRVIKLRTDQTGGCSDECGSPTV